MMRILLVYIHFLTLPVFSLPLSVEVKSADCSYMQKEKKQLLILETLKDYKNNLNNS